ncbi:MAG TPA: MFS transporter [Solirubrobacteraceae bacterium]|nr:MFS transporter [Solirubrobacteraceae bacterium]
MARDAGIGRRAAGAAAGAAGRLGRSGSRALTTALGGRERTRVIVLLASALALASADTATVGASAIQLRHDLHINNTDVGLLVSVTSLVAAAASLPLGVLADRVTRTRMLGAAIVLWGIAMIWSASVSTFGHLLLARVFLGGVTAAAGPTIASLVGDWFNSAERGRIYGYILSGELIGSAIGFAVTGGVAALSWRAAFVILALPAFVLGWLVFKLPEPARGGRSALPSDRPSDAADAAEDGDEQITDAQRIARERGIEPDPALVLTGDPQRMRLSEAIRYVLSIKTNVALILASASGYFFLAGVQTFGVEFVTKQYGVAQVLSGAVLLVVGAAGVVGVLAGGTIGDYLLHRGYLNGRILVAAIAGTAAVFLFVPAIISRSALTALPYISLAALALSAQNPPIDAARLDIVHPLLWGRAEGIRTFLRTAAQAFAPLLFGAVSDYVFGGGRAALQWTFTIMLLPLAASAYFLYTALRTYPQDVASASVTTATRQE